MDYAQIVEQDRALIQLAQPAQVRQCFGVMPGTFVNLEEQVQCGGMVGIENQDLLQDAVGGRQIAVAKGVICDPELDIGVLPVKFAAHFGLAFFEEVFAAFLTGRLGHKTGYQAASLLRCCDGKAVNRGARFGRHGEPMARSVAPRPHSTKGLKPWRAMAWWAASTLSGNT